MLYHIMSTTFADQFGLNLNRDKEKLGRSGEGGVGRRARLHPYCLKVFWWKC